MNTDTEQLMKKLHASLCPDKLEVEIRAKFVEMQAEIERLSDEVEMHARVAQRAIETVVELKAKLKETTKQQPVIPLQDEIEKLAHRRCKRYVHLDDTPYRFNEHTLMHFVMGITDILTRKETNEQ